MNGRPVRKAVILVAGFGTRFLPATKAMPKEMLPIIDKPGVQFSVEEIVAAGIEDIILITGASKRSIEDHFDANPELENRLRKQQKTELLREITRIQRLARFIYVRQPEPLGNGHATLMAERAVGNEPFILLYPDDLLVGNENAVKKMIDVYAEYQAPVMGLYKVPRRDVTKYGIAKTKRIHGAVHEVFDFIEKPTLKQAPSNLASIKGYVLPPEIFSYLKQVRRGHGGEIWLIDAIKLYNRKHAVFGCVLNGNLYDLGSKLGWLKANVEFGLRHPQFGREFRSYLHSLHT